MWILKSLHVNELADNLSWVKQHKTFRFYLSSYDYFISATKQLNERLNIKIRCCFSFKNEMAGIGQFLGESNSESNNKETD